STQAYNPTAQLAVRIAGSATNILTGHTLVISDQNNHVMTLSFDPANYPSAGINADGSNLQLYVSGTYAGTTSTKARTIEVGAVRYYAQGMQSGPKSYTLTLTDSITINDPSNISRVENLHRTLVESSFTIGDSAVGSVLGHNTLVALPADSISLVDSSPLTMLYGKANFRTVSDSLSVGDNSLNYLSKAGSSATGIVQNGLIAYYNSSQGLDTVNNNWSNLASTGTVYDAIMNPTYSV